MNNEMLVELISFLVIAFRLYILSHMKVSSVIDKMFALYNLKNHSPFIGYTLLFYIEIIL
ncbi:MAG: excinuclease ABC subunit A, partial [Nautilia sp.]